MPRQLSTQEALCCCLDENDCLRTDLRNEKSVTAEAFRALEQERQDRAYEQAAYKSAMDGMQTILTARERGCAGQIMTIKRLSGEIERLQEALAADAGRELVERVKRLEAVVEAARVLAEEKTNNMVVAWKALDDALAALEVQHG